MGLKLLDVLFNRGPYEERRRRFFRGTITANAIFLFVTLSIVVRLWFAVQVGETWRDSRGLATGPDDFRHYLVFFGVVTALAVVLLGVLIKLPRR
jgi:hypothetical protein